MASLCWLIGVILLGVVFIPSLAFIGVGYASSAGSSHGGKLSFIKGGGGGLGKITNINKGNHHQAFHQRRGRSDAANSLTSLHMNDEAHYYGDREGNAGKQQVSIEQGVEREASMGSWLQ